MKPFIVTILALRRDGIGNLEHEILSSVSNAQSLAQAQEGAKVQASLWEDWPVKHVVVEQFTELDMLAARRAVLDEDPPLPPSPPPEAIDVSKFDTILCSTCGYPWRRWKDGSGISMFPCATPPPKCCNNDHPERGWVDFKSNALTADEAEYVSHALTWANTDTVVGTPEQGETLLGSAESHIRRLVKLIEKLARIKA